MNNIEIVMPHGMLGEDEFDDLLDTILRKIAMANGDEEHNWVSKYGVDIDNDIFMMHPYCWCEQGDCVWCGGCRCPQTAFHYLIDGKEVTYQEWNDFYINFERDWYKVRGYKNPPKTHKDLGWKENINEWLYGETGGLLANSHRETKHDLICDYCKGVGIFATNGSEPGKGAPNFWYKPTNFKVWWYKFIGRDMETNRSITEKELQEILTACT